MKNLILLLVIGAALMTGCSKEKTVIPVIAGNFRLEKTQEIFFDGYSVGNYHQSLYNQDCEELVIFFITSDSIGIDPQSSCGMKSPSLYRWVYDLITIDQIENDELRRKYEQVPEIKQVIRYYPDSSLLNQYSGYFGIYETSTYDLSIVNHDVSILHCLESM